MPKKSKYVDVTITDKDEYGNPHLCGVTHEGTDFIEGNPFTSISVMGGQYGFGSPCTNKEQVAGGIRQAKRIIQSHGDIPRVVDKREGAGLMAFMGG